MRSQEISSTGVPLLDDLLGGGIPRRQSVIITGDPGSGKTILCSQIAFAQATAGSNVVLATITSEPHDKLVEELRGFTFFDADKLGNEIFLVSAYASLVKGPDEAKEVTVYELSPLGSLEDGRIRFRLACSSGTYARGLAHDLGAALEVGGHLAELRRTQIGGFRVEDAATFRRLEELVQAGEAPGGTWIPFDQIPLPFGEVTADPQQEHRISHGQTVLVRELAGEEGDWVKLINRRRELIAVGTVVERIGNAGVGIVQPKVVFR